MIEYEFEYQGKIYRYTDNEIYGEYVERKKAYRYRVPLSVSDPVNPLLFAHFWLDEDCMDEFSDKVNQYIREHVEE